MTTLDILGSCFLHTKMKFSEDKICDACLLGKQHKTSFKSVNEVATNRALDLLHMDLFGPIDIPSLRGSKYAFVIVDDYTKYTWFMFLVHKNEAFDEFAKLCRKVQNEKGYFIKALRVIMGPNM